MVVLRLVQIQLILEAFTVIDIYNDANAYMEEGPVTTIERPAHRDYLGHISSTIRQSNYYN